MVTSLYLVSLTILLTFLVLSFVEKVSTRRKKYDLEINLDQQNAAIDPAILVKH
ncbi:hypothetical protein [Aquibacillus kalidii]|uniref:hypothetical protein n=1 Tax=Aquibacillus kalidii TaxID=2762597 RepID=UPI001645C37A|nr:hypothetical protein [Aquibacillus kalidii]